LTRTCDIGFLHTLFAADIACSFYICFPGKLGLAGYCLILRDDW